LLLDLIIVFLSFLNFLNFLRKSRIKVKLDNIKNEFK